MRHALMMLMIAGGWVSAGSDDLTVGDRAPDLKIEHWLKGKEVSVFVPGRVYVVEFWATWCAPCVASMEHLSNLQMRYTSRGVTIIGVTDEPLQKVVAFLVSPSKSGAGLQHDRTRFALASDPDRSTHDAYLEAAGVEAIPIAFVVGKRGLVEWVGHPKNLDAVLEAVVEDRWDRAAARIKYLARQKSTREFREATEKLSAAIDAHSWDEALTLLDQIITGGHETYIPTKFGLLLSLAKRRDAAYEYGVEVMAQAWEDDPWLLYQLAWIVTGHDKFPVREGDRDLEFALKAAERAVKLTNETDCSMLSMLANVHAARTEWNDAVRRQASAVRLLEEIQTKVSDDELADYEAELASMRTKLEVYRSRAERAPSGGAP